MKIDYLKKVMRFKLPAALLCVFLYILLHELGHTIVLWSVGADVTEFSLIKAHVLYEGGHWTNLSDRWMHLNGTLFPVIVIIIYMLFYKRECTNRFYRIFSGFFLLMTIASLLAWVVIPFLFTEGIAPKDDDVYKFLYNFTFDYPAWTVSVGAVIVIACCIFIAAKKGVIQNVWTELKSVRNEARGLSDE